MSFVLAEIQASVKCLRVIMRTIAHEPAPTTACV